MASLWKWRGWLTIFGVFVQLFIIYGPLYNYSILFVSLREEFHSSAAVTGWVGSLANGLLSFISPLCGILLKRCSHRAVFTLGVTSFSLGFFATSFVPNIYWAFLTLGILSSVGAGLEMHTGTCLIFEWFPRKNNARAVCLAMLGTSVGLLAVAPLMNYLIVGYGWRNALRILSGGAFVVGIVDGLFLVPPPAQEQQSVKGDSEKTSRTTEKQTEADSEQTQKVDKGTDVFEDVDVETERDQSKDQQIVEADKDRVSLRFDGRKENSAGVNSGPGKKGFREMIGRVDVWLYGLSVAFAMIGWTFVIINFASFMKNLGFTADQTSLVLILFGAAEVFGKILTAFLGDHLPFLQINMIALSSVLGAMTAGFLTLATNLTEIIILSMVFGLLRGLFLGITFPSSFELFSEYGGDIVTSIVLIPWGLGILAAAPLTGGLFDISGDYTLSLLALGALFILSALCIMAIMLRRRKLAVCKKGTGHENDAPHLKTGDTQPSTDVGTENKAYDVSEE